MNDKQLRNYIAEQIDEQIQVLKRQLLRYIDNALHKRSEENDKQLITVKTTVKNEIKVAIANEIMPKIDRAMQAIAYHTVDGNELVDEYRKQVCNKYAVDPNQKMLTGGTKSETNFGNSQFFFTYDD